MGASLTGEAYDRAVGGTSDRSARSAFQALVLGSLKPGGALYDFGAGTGIDARFYAEHGYTVGAYDADPDMRQSLAMRCRDLIDSGRVILDTGSYPEFLASRTLNGGRPADLVVSNFAPLSLVECLPALFARFHTLLAPGGAVLASVLSPWYAGDLRYGWWWRNLPRLCRTGSYPVAGTAGPIVRRRLRAYGSQCAPHFILHRVYPGISGRGGAAPAAIEVGGGGALAWLAMTRCRYMFLQFRKADEFGKGQRRRSGPAAGGTS